MTDSSSASGDAFREDFEPPRLRHDPQFPSTHWSVVLAARDEETKVAHQALSALCGVYWYPVYAYARRLGKKPEEAEDLTQEFFARLLSKRYLDAADREKGRLRTFLLTAFKRFLAKEWHKEHAQKRGGGERPLSIDAAWAEDRYTLELPDHVTPEDLYEQQWASNLLDRVLNDLQARYAERGKGELFEALKTSISGDARSESYVEIGGQLGMSEGAVKVAVHRLRKQYRELLRTHIAATVDSRGDIDEEIRHLFQVFGK